MALAGAALASDDVGYALATVCTRQVGNAPSSQRVPPADGGEVPRASASSCTAERTATTSKPPAGPAYRHRNGGCCTRTDRTDQPDPGSRPRAVGGPAVLIARSVSSSATIPFPLPPCQKTCRRWWR